MSVMVLDVGDSIIKAKIAMREQGELSFPHTFQPITEAKYTNVCSCSKVGSSQR